MSKFRNNLLDQISFSSLSNLALWIVFSLPFERIPSFGLFGVNLRFSQILTVISFFIIAILIFKRDREILELKIQKPFIWLIFFYFFAIPSIFFITDFGRFVSTSIATFLAFSACFLVAHFTSNVWKSLKYLLVSMTIVGIFGFWQFFGDLANFPTTLTGLRPQYTKAVFGYPRIQATAIEPLYFAGMLFLPLFFFILILFNKKLCREFLQKEINKTFTKTLNNAKNKISNLWIDINQTFHKIHKIENSKKPENTVNSSRINQENSLETNSNIYQLTKVSLSREVSEGRRVSEKQIYGKSTENSQNNSAQNIKRDSSQNANLITILPAKLPKKSTFFVFFGEFLPKIFSHFLHQFSRLLSRLNICKFDFFAWNFLLFFSLLFFFTLSKSGWICFAGVLLLLLFWYKNHLNWEFWQRFGKFILFLSFLLLIFNLIPDFNRVFMGTLNHFAETLRGESGTITERNSFLQAAFDTLPSFAILGVGSGQFGTFARNLLNASDNTLIVNNVYVEIWLEYGFVSLLCFLGFLTSSFWQYFGVSQLFSPNFPSSNSTNSTENSTTLTNKLEIQNSQNNSQTDISPNSPIFKIIGQTLCLTMLTFCLQWLTFSPIFINPIFITLGLFLAFSNRVKD